MPRVVGIDPGTVSIDLCGLEDGAVFLDRSIPTAEALAAPEAVAALLREAGALDLVVGPSGYGLPLRDAATLTDAELRLAFLAVPGEAGGLRGFRRLVRALADARLPLLLTPGVIHLPSVPVHRKVNRIDMGTADKVCAAALAVAEQSRRAGHSPAEASLVLLELGGAFTAALAVDAGRIVDGVGGTSGPLGVRGSGALDGEVAYLAGTVTKSQLFGGGASACWGDDALSPERLAEPRTTRERVARDAFVEGAVRAVASLLPSLPRPREIVLSGRASRVDALREGVTARLAELLPGVAVRPLGGFARTAKEAAQGAALLADGLAGGANAPLVQALGLREASGTVLDFLWVLSPAAARARLELD